MSIMTTEQFVQLMIRWGNFKAKCKSRFPGSDDSKKNEELRNKYKDKRCFIIGNGPSVREQDLSLLADEVVFATNGFFRYDKYYDAKPDYYCIVDPAFFSQERGKELLKEIEKICQYERKPAFILPWEEKNVIEQEFKWNEWTDIYYIDGPMSFPDGYRKEWDIRKPIPCPQCVVQTAILLATYMGFKEIYVLGIEQTNLIDGIELYYSGKDPSRYVYIDENGSNQKAYYDGSKEVPLEMMLKGYTRIFHLYREIYLYCNSKGVSIYNCTPQSLVDSIPKIKYEDLF